MKMSEELAEVSQEINVTSILVAILKTIHSIDVPSELVLSPGDEDTGLIVSYNQESNTFTISLGDANGSN
jgi:hypothetical protein